MRRSRSAIVPVFATALIALSLAGCKSSSSSATGTTPTPTSATGGSTPTSTPTDTPAPSTAPATTPPVGSALTTLPAACPTAAEVNSDLGINTSTPGQTKTATTLDCAYIGKGAGNIVSINFTTAKKLTAAAAEAALKAQGTSPKFQRISGLGDAAFYDVAPSGGSYIAVISGGLSFHVVVGGVVAESKYATLAQTILAG